MLDVGYKHVKEFAENYALDINFKIDLSKREIDKYFSGIESTDIKDIEDYLCEAFAKYLADKDLVFVSVNFENENERYMSAYGYVDMYYRKALIKYFLVKRLHLLKERGKNEHNINNGWKS